MLANCSSSSSLTNRLDPKYGVSSSPRVVESGEVVPRGGGTFRVGKPYTVAGRLYVPEENTSYRAEGMASWYGDKFHGRLTANGEVFDMTSMTAAHPTLPMPSYVRVTNVRNAKSVIVRVNDRGPYHGNRVIDVSHRAAKLLEFDGHGVARVRVEYVGRAPLEGSDDAQLVATLRTASLRRLRRWCALHRRVLLCLPRPSYPAARSAAMCRCRKDVPIRSATRRRTWRRSTPPRRFPLRGGAGLRKPLTIIRAPYRMRAGWKRLRLQRKVMPPRLTLRRSQRRRRSALAEGCIEPETLIQRT